MMTRTNDKNGVKTRIEREREKSGINENRKSKWLKSLITKTKERKKKMRIRKKIKNMKRIK